MRENSTAIKNEGRQQDLAVVCAAFEPEVGTKDVSGIYRGLSANRTERDLPGEVGRPKCPVIVQNTRVFLSEIQYGASLLGADSGADFPVGDAHVTGI